MNNRRSGPVRPSGGGAGAAVVVVNGGVHQHPRAAGGNGGLSRPILLVLCVVSSLFLLVTTKTFLSLPEIDGPSFPRRRNAAAEAAAVSIRGGAGHDDGGVGGRGGGGDETGPSDDHEERRRRRPPPPPLPPSPPSPDQPPQASERRREEKKRTTGVEFPYLVRTRDPNDENEFEVIPHPGHQHSKNARVVPMTVPLFWEPPDGGGREGLLRTVGGGPPRRERALSIGSWTEIEDEGETVRVETIYASIASYRDFQCPETIDSLYSRARYPDRIRVAVIDQINKGRRDRSCVEPKRPCADDPDQTLCRYGHLVDVYEMDARLAVGPVFARHLGHRMYRGEYFALQIDAHVTFVRDWDEDIVHQWRSARNEMAVVTVYLSDVQGAIDETTGTLLQHDRPIMCNSDFSDKRSKQAYMAHTQQPQGRAGIRGEPTIEPYWAAGFSFARGHFVVTVPYDQHLPMVFQGEEISMGVRAFTHGYDFYTPERSVCFHTYAMGKAKAVRKDVHLFWENSPAYRGCERKSFLRLVSLARMATAPIDPNDWYHDEEDLYGVGHVRTVDKFLTTFGIHLQERRVEKHLCGFVGKLMQQTFVPHLRKDGMGIDYNQIHFRFKDPEPNKPELFADNSET